MRLRWKKDPKMTGLASVGAGPRGSRLHDGEKEYASVNPDGGNWARPLRGWYWTAFEPRQQATCATEQEAKDAAIAYVRKHLKERE